VAWGNFAAEIHDLAKTGAAVLRADCRLRLFFPYVVINSSSSGTPKQRKRDEAAAAAAAAAATATMTARMSSLCYGS